MNTTINVKLDAALVQGALDDVKARRDAGKLSPEVVDRFLDLLNVGLKTSGLENRVASDSGTREVVLRLEFTDSLAEFVAALRAGQFDSAVIQAESHNAPDSTAKGDAR